MTAHEDWMVNRNAPHEWAMREAWKIWVLVQSFQEREAQQVAKITMRKRQDFGCCSLSPLEQKKLAWCGKTKW